MKTNNLVFERELKEAISRSLLKGGSRRFESKKAKSERKKEHDVEARTTK
jgi:hypothetical protein